MSVTELNLEKLLVVRADFLSSTDKSEAELINENNIHLSLVANNKLVELFNKHNFARRGHSAWSYTCYDQQRGIVDYSPVVSFLKEAGALFGFGSIALRVGAYDRIQNDTAGGGCQLYDRETADALARYNNGRAVFPYGRIVSLVDGRLVNFYSYRYNEILNDLKDDVVPWHEMISGFSDDERAFYAGTWQNAGLLQVGFDSNSQVWVRLISYSDITEVSDRIEIINVHKSHRKGKKTLPLSAHSALKAVIDFTDRFTGESEFLPDFLDYEGSHPEALALLEQADETVAVGYLPNKPTSVVLKIGRNVKLPLGMRHYPRLGKPIRLSEVLKLEEKYTEIPFLIHPALGDIINMSKAKPFKGDSRLMGYQQEAVGLHLSTSIGYVQSCSPGLGKTVIQLSAMRERAKLKKADGGVYRALVICEANVREQWKDDFFEDWFPEAKVVALTSSSQKQVEKLVAALSLEEPVVIITSYALTNGVVQHVEALQGQAQQIVSALDNGQPVPRFELDVTLGSVLNSVYWDDLCADEAKQIRNNSSKQAEAAWLLRKNSEVATALIGTPINKSINDVGNLISWVRGDARLFTGDALSNQLAEAENSDTMTTTANTIFKTLSPLLFRRDSSILNEQKTELVAKVKNVKHDLYPNPAEKALAFAAEQELKRCYKELVEALDGATNTNVSVEEQERIKERVKQAHGAWLGGTHLARMSMSDPESLVKSNSVSAALLKSQGLVSGALTTTPTKRKKLVEVALKAVGEGKQMLVFTDFASVAKILVETLEQNGIRAGEFSGKNQSSRANNLRRYKAGELDVLVLTSAGERGLNLQNTDVLCHYDIPWTPENLIQRTARAVRIGSGGKKVEVMFLVMKDTIEERVARNVMKSGITSSMVLDNSRGVNLSETETALSIMGLVDLLSDGDGDNSQIISNYAELLKK